MGKLEISFPDHSSSKWIYVQPAIVAVRAEQDEPMYDLTLGVETMSKLGIVLDFSDSSITIYDQKSPMKPLSSFKNLKGLNTAYKE